MLFRSFKHFKHVATHETEPPSLTFIENYHGFEIYSSEFNTDLRIVKNPTDNKYHAFESTQANTDLNKKIKPIITTLWGPFNQ